MVLKTIRIDEQYLLPLDGFGVDYELVETQEPALVTEQTPVPINYELDLSDFIFLNGVRSGREKRPDLLVCKYRLGVDGDVVRNARRELGLTVENTAKEQNGRGYAGNMNQEQAVKLNLLLGGRTSNTRIARDFSELILSGNVEDGNHRKIKSEELAKIANEIFEIRGPYRAEWFEDNFNLGEDGLVLNKNYVLENGVLIPQYSYPLTTCLMEDRIPGVDLKDWLKNSTAQGFPRKNIKTGKTWYAHPRADSAVGFDAFSGGAGLCCGRFRRSSDPGLGVRHVREAHAQK